MQARLQTVDGVANAQILGGQTFAMRIWLDPVRMAALGVTPNDVRAALPANNFTTAAGEVKSDYNQISVDAKTSLDSAEAFGKLVIAARGDALVRLGDVATIDLGPQGSDSSVDLRRPQGGVHRRLRHAGRQPAHRHRRCARHPAEHRGAAARRNEGDGRLRRHGLHPHLDQRGHQHAGRGAAIVIVIIYLFLGTVRSVIIPIVAMPLSLIGACFLMLAMGFTINLLTLLAMVLAIGLVVDDAIVVVENIHRHIEEGLSPLERRA